MSEKQAIEVGQIWQVNQPDGAIATLTRISPAWVTLENDDFIWRLRKSQFREEWRLEDDGKKVEPIDLGDDTPADNTSTHATMQSAIAAFNAQTGLKLSEHHGWLLMLNIELVQTGNPTEIHGKDCFMLYQESREVD